MNAVGAQHANHHSPDGADYVAGVGEGFWHRQDACSQTAFHQVEEGFDVPVE